MAIIAPEQGTCALCGTFTTLQKSHIVPKFTTEWLKETSGTGYLRGATQPNVRKQNSPIYRLLCSNCEEIFSPWEKQFAEDIFIPYQEKRQQVFRYQEWLLRFVVSLAWRTITVTADSRFHTDEPNLALESDVALTFWKDYLLGESNDPGPYAHHMLFLDYISPSTTATIPEFTHWYMLRSIDATVAYASKEVYAYTKLPGIVFWSGIYPDQPKGWQNTRIRRSGNIQTQQTIEDNGFVEFLMGRTQILAKTQLSERQQEKINQTIAKNPARFIHSESAQIFQTEQFWKSWQEQS